VKGFGVGILRWLAGIILGLIAAALLFGLAARVTPAPDVGAAVGQLALLVGGFGLAFFPIVFSMGTRSPRQVARRGFIGLALEGLIALVLAAYQLITGSSPIPSSALGWIGVIGDVSRSLAALFSNNLLLGGMSLVILAVTVFLFIALRAPATAPRDVAPARAVPGAGRADSPSARPPAVSQPRPGALPSTAAAQPAAGPKSEDEDAQLMADLENLRKKLPKMGVDESGSSGPK
jgi:hypothetical protein